MKINHTRTVFEWSVKKLLRFPSTSSIVQIIFSFWFFEISEGILRNRKIIIGLDSFSYQRLKYILGPILILLDFVLTTLLKGAKLQ